MTLIIIRDQNEQTVRVKMKVGERKDGGYQFIKVVFSSKSASHFLLRVLNNANFNSPFHLSK